MVNADAMAWMRAQTGPFSGSVVTGIPDISEVSLAPDEYRAFFLEAVEILRRTVWAIFRIEWEYIVKVLPASYVQVPLTSQATPDSMSESSDVEMKTEE